MVAMDMAMATAMETAGPYYFYQPNCTWDMPANNTYVSTSNGYPVTRRPLRTADPANADDFELCHPRRSRLQGSAITPPPRAIGGMPWSTSRTTARM